MKLFPIPQKKPNDEQPPRRKPAEKIIALASKIKAQLQKPPEPTYYEKKNNNSKEYYKRINNSGDLKSRRNKFQDRRFNG